MSTHRTVAFLSGLVMSINFLVFWAVPIMGMGVMYKNCLKPFLKPIYDHLEAHEGLRKFAANYIYTKPEHADFFAMSMLTILSCSISIPTMFYWQLTKGYLPWWLIALYYCSWVGIGGSIMGSAYGLAHKEVSGCIYDAYIYPHYLFIYIYAYMHVYMHVCIYI